MNLLRMHYRWRHSPAVHHELYQLELPWFGATSAVQELTDLVKQHNPSILFLMEIRCKESFLKNLCDKLQMQNVFFVPRHNTGGGLALYWKDEIDLHGQNSSPTFIEAMVNPKVDDSWQFTIFFGNPITAN